MQLICWLLLNLFLRHAGTSDTTKSHLAGLLLSHVSVREFRFGSRDLAFLQHAESVKVVVTANNINNINVAM